MTLRYEFVHDAMKFWVFDDDRGGLLLSTHSKEDASRIVAAVNACAGIKIEDLEAGIVAFPNRVKHLDSEVEYLRAENERLREFLEDFVFSIEIVEPNQGKRLSDLAKTARAALSEAEK